MFLNTHSSSSNKDVDMKIELETDHIVFHGSEEEAAGVMLRGTLIVDCHEPTRIKTIRMRLNGKLHVHWLEVPTQRHFKDKRHILDHEWELLTTPQYLEKGETRFPFEMPLSGKLPASFQHEIASLVYQLRAHAERPAFLSSSISVSRPFQVSRVPLANDAVVDAPQQVQNEWANKLLYSVQVPHQMYVPGSCIPVRLDLLPLSPDVSVAHAELSLKQHIQFKAGSHTSVESKTLITVKDTALAAEPSAVFASGNSFLCKVPIPNKDNANADLHVDTQNDLIHAYHKLKITVALLNPDGHISELRVSMPIHLVETIPEEDGNALPAYEDAWRTLPYSQDADRSSPSSIASSSASSASASDDDTLPWMCADLTRVPSYTTALRTGRLYSYSGNSLPSYDALLAAANSATTSTSIMPPTAQV
ncbi:hypothetical protein BC940DRAFT_332920 [Gongronella butleri]|nr:hypothetical protein BC940DRAFT_332920 [Gongronella butleri]